ncbi:MAG: rod shape-determining protein RodA [Candidatus Jettenia sp.]|uniref:Peptidoglycan glycosyltransferase RodA n=1 Tax=Candidatus Jettenia caeni TaxID=247490 RepID=I3IJ67_9BACT|nr:rod shape-determining protein RodA [Candidatus Jettenia sp. AMX1]MBC6927495.1 rod shape-determining protein RodA [Candidatus Jettenia sp.]NUN22024.1 rod shape-determining protein RodA [Candidatus Jettenia caeni]KAA0249782.1 MAG: rod shape-determining protein RodA [Candidatus Jettenia sp. AMX1]MCE7879178.1 rod shape-determining protein RodA [Candidatus Jettenia sp. AMX1]MCQ3925703.1 rod shape-determining protein RodA [Candidatus Jettenia sp.]
MSSKVNLRNFDWLIFLILCTILTIGVFFVWSASSERFLFKQIIWVVMGFTLFFTLLYFDYLSFEHYAYIIYASVLFLLILLLSIGGSVKGSQRWFSIGSFSVQPSEFMKITLVLTLAKFLRYKKYGLGFFDIGISLLLAFIPMALIMKQPDLGTALILVPILFSILYAAGIRLSYLLILIGTGLAISPLFWMFMLKSYQKLRIIGFLWPEKTTDWGAGYHRLQSLIAIGSGGLFGTGWGNGTQNQMKFLPERHTDFIFAVIAEEWGFLRACLVLLLYIAFVACGIGIARNTRDPYGRLVVVGLVTMFATQIVVNVGMTLGVAPIVGVTLPFISYGGSSMLTSFVALSIIFNVKMRSKIDLASRRFYEMRY